MPALLEAKNLSVEFLVGGRHLQAVQNVSLKIEDGESVAIVGESGCGKSATATALMSLISPPGRVNSVEILFKGKNREEIIRGKDIGMVFQEPMTSLNPVLTIGTQIIEPLRLHLKMDFAKAKQTASELLAKVGIKSHTESLELYPHQLSGGMRQRVMIAMAISCAPSLLIADEPTTALDVTIQSQILSLIDTLVREKRMGLLLITHDLGVVAERTDRAYIMYSGIIVESAPTSTLLARPFHPYTKGLLDSLPQRNPPGRPLPVIKGSVVREYETHKLCPFRDRCPDCFDLCLDKMPELTAVEADREVRCWKYIA